MARHGKKYLEAAKLVDHEREHPIVGFAQPRSRLVKQLVFDATHEHRVEH